jgi:uncharacterized protein YbjT (DUF2867 family)
LLAGGQFAVRCLTRDPHSVKAESLKNAGAEVVQGDLSDPASLLPALEGCQGVFGVTNYWEHFAAEREHGRNLVDAVAAAGVPDFVLSTLPSVKRITNGALEAPHLDIKAEIEDYARGRLPNTTFIHVAFYYENFTTFFPPQRQEDGSYAFGFPQGDTPLAAVSAADVGGVVGSIFARAQEYRGRTIGVVGDELRGDEFAAILSQVTGQTVRYNYVPYEVFAGFGFPGADDLAAMFEFNRVYVPSRQADIDESLRLNPEMQRFGEWARGNAEALRAALKA